MEVRQKACSSSPQAELLNNSVCQLNRENPHNSRHHYITKSSWGQSYECADPGPHSSTSTTHLSSQADLFASYRVNFAAAHSPLHGTAQ